MSTKETRKASYEVMKPRRFTRHQQILEILSNKK